MTLSFQMIRCASVLAATVTAGLSAPKPGALLPTERAPAAPPFTMQCENTRFTGGRQDSPNGLMFTGFFADLRLGFDLPSDLGAEFARAASAGVSPADDHHPRVALDRTYSRFVFDEAAGRAVPREKVSDGNPFRAIRSLNTKPGVADFRADAGPSMFRGSLPAHWHAGIAHT